MDRTFPLAALTLAVLAPASASHAQRADENAARAALDAFGTNIGNERVGLYTTGDVRGFSPTTAGNLRLEGLYFDFRTAPPPRMVAASQVRVALTAQSYPFPAPTGIVDYVLRPAGRPYASTYLQAGPNGAYNIEFDAATAIKPDRLAIAWGVHARRDEEQPKDTARFWGYSVSPRWWSTAWEIRPFLGYTRRDGDKAAPTVFASGPRLPNPTRSVNYSPDWTGTSSSVTTLGVLTTVALSPAWTFRGGLMRFENWDEGPVSDSFLNVGGDGEAQVRRFADQPPYESNSNSGEARLTGALTRGDYRHTLHASVRGRRVNRNFGGAAVASLAATRLDSGDEPSEPGWTYGLASQEAVRQWSGGLNYLLARRGWGEAGVAVQKIDYRRTLTRPGDRPSTSSERPLFWSGGVSFTAIPRLAAYGAFTEGLEEAPIAPDVAVNAQEAPPAIHTKQHEAGVRYLVSPALRLVAGYFSVEKPYFNLDGARLWRALGVERHRGLELSLTGELLPGLNVVAGYVRMKPEVVGEAVAAGLIGPEPVGQPHDTGRLNLDYRPASTAALSFDGGVTLYGSRPVSARAFAELKGKQPRAPQLVTVDLGLRYRFSVSGRRSTLRLQALNVLNAQKWQTTTAGGMTVSPPRRLFISVATDF